jgi:hypothetical protein
MYRPGISADVRKIQENVIKPSTEVPEARLRKSPENTWNVLVDLHLPTNLISDGDEN